MGGRVAVSSSAPPVLMPPLRGGPWAAVYFPMMAQGHRRVPYALDGRVHIPARLAMDWMKIDEGGRLASGDATRVANWHGYGADVLAVGDGTVVAVRSSMEESQTVEHVAHGLAKETGNRITLDLGDGLYVSYEHLRPGSVLVSVGDRVQASQTIAQLGVHRATRGARISICTSATGRRLSRAKGCRSSSRPSSTSVSTRSAPHSAMDSGRRGPTGPRPGSWSSPPPTPSSTSGSDGAGSAIRIPPLNLVIYSGDRI